jgi:hypothetical protein
MKKNNSKFDNSDNEHWKLYELLSNTLPLFHSRWVDNYKIFLSFNSFLLPAATALLGYAVKENLIPLRYFVFLLCMVGILASYFGFRLLKRIRLDTDLRFYQLIRLEESLKCMPLMPFTEGRDFFFKNKNISTGVGDDLFSQGRNKDKGIRAIDAYKYISWAISLFYIVLGTFSIWPLFTR